jgi:hypothetical protein
MDWDDLLLVDGELYGSYAEAFRACCELYSHPVDYYLDLKREAVVKTAEEGEDGVELDEEDVPDEEDDYPLDAFEVLARRRPGMDLELPLVDGLDSLGSRDLDRNYDWSLYVGKYDIPLEIWD